MITALQGVTIPNLESEKIVGISADSYGNISPSVINPSSGCDAMETVLLYFDGNGPTPDVIKAGETVLGVIGTYAGVELPSLSNPASASEILKGKEAINANGSKITGTIETKTSSNLTASGATVTVPAGYYATNASKSVSTATRANTTIAITADDTNDKLTITAANNQGAGYVAGANKTATATITLTASGSTVTASDGSKSISKSVTTATQATPGITVSSAGLITASATQTAGYVAAGTKSNTKQLTTKAAATYTPGTTNQTINSGYYLTGTQTILGDADLVAGNIKNGVQIFGVTGTYTGEASKIKTVSLTILDEGENLSNTVKVTYTTIDNNNNPYVTSVEVIHTDWYDGTILTVVQGTPIIIESAYDSYTVGYVRYSGFTSISMENGVVVAHVGANDCQIVPSQTEKVTEDLSAELAAQDELIADIKTAVAGKAAGGSGIETCNFTIHRNSMSLTQQCIPYIDSNGKLDAITGAYALEDTGDISFNVPKNAIIMLNVDVTETATFEDITDYMNMSWINGVYFYKITGDTEITIN